MQTNMWPFRPREETEPADAESKTTPERTRSPRGMILSILGAVTLGVAVLSMVVSFQILDPRFGGWAIPTVGALDTLWVVFQATEILAGNNTARARRVRWAGLLLTAVNAAIPTADLIMTGDGHFDLAVVLTPIAIIATKTAWWVTLPSLGRKVSPSTRLALAAERQQVSDQLEKMVARTSHRVELFDVATGLEDRLAKAEKRYRKARLRRQEKMTEDLHQQAESTAKTISEKALPSSVTDIVLPELDTWSPDTPALLASVTPDVDSAAAVTAGVTNAVTPWALTGTSEDADGTLPAQFVTGVTDTDTGATLEVTQVRGGTANGTLNSVTRAAHGTVTVPGLDTKAGVDGAHETVTGADEAVPAHAHDDRDAVTDEERAVTLAELAKVEGVPTPEPGEKLSDRQLMVVLRHLRYRKNPPSSYRQAVADFRDAGYVGSEKRVRQAWGELMSHEEDDSSEPNESSHSDGDAERDEEDDDEVAPRA